MSQKDWHKFFNLLEMIVEMDKPTVSDKIQVVRDAAAECGDDAETNLDEFTSWDFDR
jgi:hypothetical protein